jgi:hypothetical protein
MKKGQKLHQATTLAQQLKVRQKNQSDYKKQRGSQRISAARSSNKYKKHDSFPYWEILIFAYRVLKKIARKIFT